MEGIEIAASAMVSIFGAVDCRVRQITDMSGPMITDFWRTINFTIQLGSHHRLRAYGMMLLFLGHGPPDFQSRKSGQRTGLTIRPGL